MSKKRIAMIVAIGMLVLLIMSVLIVTSRQSAESPARLISLGEKYLTELNYEQALVQFLKVIEIDPMNPRGYTGAADAYIGLGRTGDAVTILHQGFERIGDEGIRGMLDELENNQTNEFSDDSTSEKNQESALNIDEGFPLNNENDNIDNEEEFTNFTNREVFTSNDLTEWESPLGLTLDEAIKIFDYDEDAVSELQSGRAAEEYPGPWGNVLFNTPYDLSIDSVTLKICGLEIKGDDNVVGPRGMKIGMSIEDVLKLFACTNMEAIEFVKNPVNDRTAMISWIQVYNLRSGQYDASISCYGFAYDTYNSDYAVIYWDYQTNVALHAYCMDGTVNRISIFYF